MDAVRRRRDDGVQVILRGHPGTIEAKLTRIETRATVALPHLALGAASGGPLALRQQTSMQSDRERGLALQRFPTADGATVVGRDPEDEALAHQELVSPRLIAHAKIDNQSGHEATVMKEGEWGYAELTGGQSYRLGEWLFDKVATYVKHQFDRARNVGS
ncbi:MAG: hypothetical protein KDL87_19930, partial [Verrucomicrobiae bacterium]|nr:hypothetical protein [Verrucomicrobiae bacterium]